MKFWKMHGAGNDFVVFDAMTSDVEIAPERVRQLCDRHFGIGADGVIIVRRSNAGDGFMDYINADGTYAQMCGNGVRVVAKFLVDHGYVDPATGSCVVDTRAGLKNITFTTAHGLLETATVDMGSPILDPVKVPARAEVEGDHGVVRIETEWGPADLITVSMGNPHGVWFLDRRIAATPEELAALDIDAVGAYLESHEAFPENANIEFVVPGNGLHMRVFERGVGETLACGTGACAVQVAAALSGRAGASGEVHLPGGILHIAWDETTVYMTGPATTVFDGHIEGES